MYYSNTKFGVNGKKANGDRQTDRHADIQAAPSGS